MMKSYILLLFLVLSITFSCKREGNIYNFPNIIEINNGIKVDSNLFLKSGFIKKTKEFIIINDIYSTNKYFHLYERKNLKHISSHGIIGRGPGEIGRPGGLIFDKSKNCLWVNDYYKKLIWEFPIDSIVTNNTFKPNVNYSLKFDSRIDYYLPLSNNGEFYYNTFSDSIYAKYDPLIDTLSFYGDKSFFINEVIKQNAIPQMMATEICINDELGKKAVAFKHYDIIAILDRNNKPLQILRGKDKIAQENPQILDPFKTIKAYTSIKYGKNNIYAAYCGKVIFEGNQSNYKSNNSKEIHVFDWDGNPQVKYILKNEFIDFEFDEENNHLIVFDLFEGLIYFNLNEL